ASGFNAGFIKEMGIGPGSIIKVTRANEVIPHIVDSVVKKDPQLVDKCPTCNTDVEEKALFLMCPNKTCEAQAISLIWRLISLIELPKGLGGTTIENYLRNFPDNYNCHIKIDSLLHYLIS